MLEEQPILQFHICKLGKVFEFCLACNHNFDCALLHFSFIYNGIKRIFSSFGLKISRIVYVYPVPSALRDRLVVKIWSQGNLAFFLSLNSHHL